MDDDFFKDLDGAIDVKAKAKSAGLKVGLPQDLGIFYDLHAESGRLAAATPMILPPEASCDYQKVNHGTSAEKAAAVKPWEDALQKYYESQPWWNNGNPVDPRQDFSKLAQEEKDRVERDDATGKTIGKGAADYAASLQRGGRKIERGESTPEQKAKNAAINRLTGKTKPTTTITR